METIAPEGSQDEVRTDSELALTAPGRVAQETERLRLGAAASWRAARSRLARVGDDVRIEARSTAHAAERYARQKPWRVAGVAAAVALLAGVVIGARLGAAALRRQQQHL
jgi:ElaB/YqjD/DUF883 family membrane-anchored ribosome-binding protein